MIAYAIKRNDQGTPDYFAPASGPNCFHPDPLKGILFAREQDAQIFTDQFLPHFAPLCTITPIKLEKD